MTDIFFGLTFSDTKMLLIFQIHSKFGVQDKSSILRRLKSVIVQTTEVSHT